MFVFLHQLFLGMQYEPLGLNPRSNNCQSDLIRGHSSLIIQTLCTWPCQIMQWSATDQISDLMVNIGTFQDVHAFCQKISSKFFKKFSNQGCFSTNFFLGIQYELLGLSPRSNICQLHETRKFDGTHSQTWMNRI